MDLKKNIYSKIEIQKPKPFLFHFISFLSESNLIIYIYILKRLRNKKKKITNNIEERERKKFNIIT